MRAGQQSFMPRERLLSTPRQDNPELQGHLRLEIPGGPADHYHKAIRRFARRNGIAYVHCRKVWGRYPGWQASSPRAMFRCFG